ncbi:cytochrome P450 81C13-like [Malania oleifera]|uniref:cytochrome P450 81C13-like n=1 Tax=Malania oleifera TaxID=397392 RepID=UPI0025AE7227|nr:cytochrome P450 81C13-like [Malania oleifera]
MPPLLSLFLLSPGFPSSLRSPPFLPPPAAFSKYRSRHRRYPPLAIESPASGCTQNHSPSHAAATQLVGRRWFRLQLRPRRISPPTPFALPIIGHLHLIKNPLHVALERLSLRYGPILNLRLGVLPIVVVSSPSAVEECFTKNDIILANRSQYLAGDVLSYDYTSLAFASYGHLWRRLRRRNFLPSSGSQKVELRYFFLPSKFNALMRIIAGKRSIEGKAATTDMGIRQHLQQELRETFLPSLSMNMCDFLPILRWVGYKGLEKNMVKICRNRDEFLQNLIDEVRQKKASNSFNCTPNMESGKKMTVIENLLSLQESEPELYSDNLIKSIIALMFVAGTDKSAITLEWAMSLLLDHPKVLEKVRAEIDNHVEHERLIDELDLSKLPYLRCIVYETLRLYPVGPLLLPHFSSGGCTLGGYDIPRRTVLLVNVWALHRDPKVWEEPEKFKPERFEGTEGDREGFKFIPFGVGRRASPGAGIGMRIVSLALGTVIQCFEWEKVGQEVDMSCNFATTMARAEPLEVVCAPRQNFFKLLSQL